MSSYNTSSKSFLSQYCFTVIDSTLIQHLKWAEGLTTELSCLFSFQSIKMIAKDLFTEVIDEFTHAISKSLVSAVQGYLGHAGPISEDIQYSLVQEEVKYVTGLLKLNLYNS